MNSETTYNPDVLLCLANLSNDEVFTPPNVAVDMLNLLPDELWSDPNATFLDPASKSGIFLREIAKRLMKGLEEQIPDLQDRINHIYTKQLYGIAITELTSLLSRRSLYCSKFANGKYSIVTNFNDEAGNIMFERTEHKWFNDKCLFCGASQAEYDRSEELETHAYKFIHTTKPEELYNMKFDVIIGNPPYQLSDGGGGGSASPIYQKFVNQAIKLQPRYLSMIIPSRWYSGGRGLDEFRDTMLRDKRMRKIVDYPEATDAFTGVQIKGGVMYFLWDKEYEGDVTVSTFKKDNIVSTATRPLLENGADIFIRYNEAVPILHKILNKKESRFSDLVSTQKPFGLRTFVKGDKHATATKVKLYTNSGFGFIDKLKIIVNKDWINKHKIYITMAYGAGEGFPHQIINKPIYGAPGTACTETYLFVGPFEDENIARNVLSYMSTRLFRFLVMLRKNTQHAAKGVYQFVPIQNFDGKWTDEKLYSKYGLTEEEIDFIESMIRPMELS